MKTNKLSRSIIDHKVSSNTIGVYWLGKKKKGSFDIRYVGRSDSCVKTRLMQHIETDKFTHFSFKSTKTIYEAFRLECMEWHLRADHTYNKIHPDSPRHLPYVCPYCMAPANDFKNLCEVM
jgi:hypothetical protein